MTQLRRARATRRRRRRHPELEDGYGNGDGDTQAEQSAQSVGLLRSPSTQTVPEIVPPAPSPHASSRETLQLSGSDTNPTQPGGDAPANSDVGSYLSVPLPQYPSSSLYSSSNYSQQWSSSNYSQEWLSESSPLPSSSSEYPQGQSFNSSRPRGRGTMEDSNAPHELDSTRESLIPLMGSSGLPQSESPNNLPELGHDFSRYPTPGQALNQYLESTEFTESRTTLLTPPEGEPSSANAATTDISPNPQPVSEKWSYPDDRFGAAHPYFGGESKLILYLDEVEADDKYHMPADDDDITYRPIFKEYIRSRAMVSAVGSIFLLLGLLALVVVLPVLTFAIKGGHPPTTLKNDPSAYHGPAWAHVNNRTYEMLKNVRVGLIDPATPDSAKTRKSTFDGSKLDLVYSDEFNDDGRTFYQGDDPFWTAPNIWYGSTGDMEWYDPDAVTTRDGTLQIQMDAFQNHDLPYRSGMLNSWNQLCFKGGVLEISASLAGPAGVPGLWPGLWSLGNLGRPGYRASTDGLWPYSYDTCNHGILPNQSSPDGLSFLPGQKLSSCSCKGETHPSRGTGRGAPEIDIIEASVDPNSRIGVVTQSYQVAPFDVLYRPNAAFMEIPNYNTTSINAYCGGVYQQAISATTMLNNKWYAGKEFQKYAFEYIPGNSDGKIAWFVGEDRSFALDGRAIGPNGNVGQRVISQEPMSMVLNLGMSGSWSQILFDELKFPTVMHVDYVRIYQKPGEKLITCDPPGYPTTDYIAKHPAAYNNPNFTSWKEAGYSWPKNELTGC